MTKLDTERHKRWKEKQIAAGKRSITIMVDDWLKEMIDSECKRTDSTIASVIERAVIYLIDPAKTGTTIEMPVEEMQQITNDLLGVVHKIERIAGMEAAVTSNKK